ncbi:tripartite tricarboxylate transporter substrate binding protein [Achromobacter denitrificans]|uniref:Bug family tripartite tricarboxylate transporter substrate binding protein n=1 Tax=Achromobacter denitrificans TaxID=32002 RepID=UPI000787B80A|nr:tripartite tricarboxylate transporter substrate binding protein [Achromobacter denitrificans]MDX3876911.1 tripartite tricarboxylate transporter substrate binding protein [Achromobacter sp.]ASC65501.1 tripartite tricarboxylate transporter substrate binding protein [Achromobacter denitrificans]MBV2159603.1 tripartite tricarboxylate transporter substrate binding protein [Achromobacter denitrificans]MDF3857103.1 tripartite tricarboxylate transporter substrate binding protein [Achromobacter denit
MSSRHRIAAVLGCLSLSFAGAAPAAAADAYPSKPIRLIVPYPAGGGFDTVARRLADGLRERLATPVIVENKPGGNTIIATDTVVRAQPDGYTLLMNAPAGIVQGPWLQKLPYDPIQALQPLYMVAQVPTALIVPTSLGVSTFDQFKAYAGAHKGEMAYASLGSGSTFHIFGAMLNERLGAQATHVPYKGDAPAMSDLVPGRVQFMFNNPVSAINFAKQDKVRILAISGATRLPAIKDIPTLGELGMPEFNITGWYGLFAPAGTPRPVADKLADAVKAVMQTPALREYLETVGVVGGDSGVDAFTRQVAEEYQAWGELIKKNDIRFE